MSLRSTNLGRLNDGKFDVLIVGGGINGAVSAAALASRGLSVAIVERGDFASCTSQASSNLVWGGFKYLENYEFSLVRDLCTSRNRLMDAYPSNVTEIGFLAALDQTAPVSRWLATLGAVGYWGLGNFKTKPPRPVSKSQIERLEPVINSATLQGGLEYADAYLKDNDARFVFSFVRSAMDVGAVAANYVELVSAEQVEGSWKATLRDIEGDTEMSLRAKTIVNAAGPFIDGLNESWQLKTEHRIVYSKGIHLIVDRLTSEERVLAFFDDTGRLFYVIPMGARSVIGTTDTRVEEVATEVSEQDRTFLLEQINARLNLDTPLTENSIIAERCGVRPLVVKNDGDDRRDVDWTSLSRKHEIEVDHTKNVVSIFGGKLTDCLNVGEEVVEAAESLGMTLSEPKSCWYGEPSEESRDQFYRQAIGMKLDEGRQEFRHEPISDRLWRRYGRRAFDMLDAIRVDPAMGENIMEAVDYLRVELHHTAETEMVTKLDDFLRRRSKISLTIPEEEITSSPGLFEAAEILFGDQAEQKLIEFFGSDFGSTVT